MAASVTIEDVAQRAGVSIKTVSRVVNREPNVRDKTRAKVQEAITALDYRPNQAARGLAGRRSYMIGLLYDQHSANYLAHLQAGVLDSCNDAGYGLALCPASLHADDLIEHTVLWLKNTQVDGVLVTPPLSDSVALMTAISELDVPSIVVSSVGPGTVPSVMIDERGAARQMTEHLISTGHTQIAFIKGHPDHYASGQRFQGFLGAMQAADLRVEDDFVFDGRFDFDSGVAAAQHLLALDKIPTAIFASNDDMAAGVLHVAHRAGLSVPADLAVAGFDDTPISRQIWPSLTTVRQPIRQMGMKAIEILLNVIKKPTNPADGGAEVERLMHRIDFELKERGSTVPQCN